MQKVDKIAKLQRAVGVDDILTLMLTGLRAPKGSIGQNQKMPPAGTVLK